MEELVDQRNVLFGDDWRFLCYSLLRSFCFNPVGKFLRTLFSHTLYTKRKVREKGWISAMCRMKRHHVDMVFSLYNHVRRFCGVLVGMLHSRSLVFQEWIMVFTPSIRQRSAICYLLLSG